MIAIFHSIDFAHCYTNTTLCPCVSLFSEIVVIVVLVCDGLRHFSCHFGHRLLNYSHCSWASLLNNSPVLRAHSFANNWQLPFLKQRRYLVLILSPVTDNCPSWISGRERMAVEIISFQSPRKNVAGREDRTSDSPHTRRTRIRPCYRARYFFFSEICNKRTLIFSLQRSYFIPQLFETSLLLLSFYTL